MNLLSTILNNGTHVTIVIYKVRAFVRTDEGFLKVYWDNGECDTTVENYDDFMDYLISSNEDVHFMGFK